MTINQSTLNQAINLNIDNLIVLLSGVELDNYTYWLTDELLIELVSTKKRLVPEFLTKKEKVE